jgi:hypothetical protein
MRRGGSSGGRAIALAVLAWALAATPAEARAMGGLGPPGGLGCAPLAPVEQPLLHRTSTAGPPRGVAAERARRLTMPVAERAARRAATRGAERARAVTTLVPEPAAVQFLLAFDTCPRSGPRAVHSSTTPRGWILRGPQRPS